MKAGKLWEAYRNTDYILEEKMRRKGLMKKTAAMVLAVTIAATSVSMGNSVSVYATDTEINNHVEDCNLEKDYIGADQEQFIDVETSNDKISEAMEQLADDAKQKADDAAQKVEEIKKTINDLELDNDGLEELKETADTATETAKTATEKAGDNAETVSEAIANAEAAEQTVSSYDNEVASDQAAADAISITDISGDVETQKETAKTAADEAEKLLNTALEGENADSVVKVGDEEKTVTEVVELVKEAAQEAEKAADEADAMVAAKELELKAAILEYNIYAMTYGLPLYGEETVSYDLTTMTEEDFEKLGITKEDIESIRNATTQRESFEEQVAAVKATEIEEITEEVEDAKQAAKDAAEAADKASTAVSEAKKLITNEEGTGCADVAIETADKAVNYETTPAKEAMDNAKIDADKADEAVTKAKEAKTKVEEEQAVVKQEQQQKIDEANSALKVIEGYEIQVKYNQDVIDDLTAGTGLFGLFSSKYDQAQSEIENLNDEIADIQDKINAGGYYKYIFVGWHTYTEAEINNMKNQIADLEKKKEKPQATIDKYNNAIAARDQANKDIAKQPKTRKQLENEISNAQGAIKAADNTIAAEATKVTVAQATATEKHSVYDDKKAVYDKKVAERDAAVAEANAIFKKEATENIVNNIKDTLKNYSKDINQVEFDKELNAWANTVFDKYENNVNWSWKFWETIKDITDVQGDAKAVREYMDDSYDASYWNEFFNRLGITQWAVSTEEREAVMASIIDGYRDAMIPYEKELATINAQFAKNEAQEAKDAFTGENGYDATVAGINNVVSDAAAAIAKADSDIAEAKEKYNTASTELADAKNKVELLSLASFDISKLSNMISEATSKLTDAKNALALAEASKDAATTYKSWAMKLIEEHISSDYAKTDDKGNFVGKEAENFNLDSVGEEISVPYSIYRAYTKELLENYDRAENVSSAKGVDLDKNMILYWLTEKDDNGNLVLTGEYVKKPSKTGTYFVGYEFKESDGEYTVNGYMYKYKAPDKNNGGNGGNDDNGGNNDDGNNGVGGNGGNNGVNGNIDGNGGVTTVSGRGERIALQVAGTENGRLIDADEEDAQEVKEETKEKEIVKNEEKTVEPTKVAIQENEVPLAEAPVQAETSSQWWVIVLTALVLTAIGFGLYKGMQAKKVQK